jgi:hypothetical protein
MKGGTNVVEANEDTGYNRGEYLSELFNFACVLRGEVKYLEKIKEHVIEEYVEKGLVKMIKPTYEKHEIYLLTDAEWKEYQRLKNRDSRLIGAGF